MVLHVLEGETDSADWKCTCVAGHQGQQEEPKTSEQQPESGPTGLPAAAPEASPPEQAAATGEEAEQSEQQQGTTPMVRPLFPCELFSMQSGGDLV